MRHTLRIFCYICQYRMGTTLNIIFVRRTLPTAVSAHLFLWLPGSYVDYFFFFPFWYLGFSCHFLPARCLTEHFAPFSLCGFSSFSLLVSQLQMSNPSTPPQAVRGIVDKCVMPHECFCICRKVGTKCAR